VFATDAVIYLWDFDRRQMDFVGVGSARWDESCQSDSGFARKLLALLGSCQKNELGCFLSNNERLPIDRERCDGRRAVPFDSGLYLMSCGDRQVKAAKLLERLRLFAQKITQVSCPLPDGTQISLRSDSSA
jgi:hypothetical protein